MATEYLWHGRRYWTMEPKGNEHIGWNTRFEQCEVTKKTATRVHILSPSCGKMQLNRMNLERDGKDSRVHEYFYVKRPVNSDFIASINGTPPAFRTLGLSPGCSQVDVKRAYKKLAKIHHLDTGGSREAFIRLHAAYKEALAIAQ